LRAAALQSDVDELAHGIVSDQRLFLIQGIGEQRIIGCDTDHRQQAGDAERAQREALEERNDARSCAIASAATRVAKP